MHGESTAAVVISRGSLDEGTFVLDYYTTQPAPTQWVAVGVAVTMEKPTSDRSPHRLFVGTGRSEKAAIQALARRLQRFDREAVIVTPEPRVPQPQSCAPSDVVGLAAQSDATASQATPDAY